MDEVELIDKALEGCYGLQDRIATLLAKLTDINMEKGISLSAKDSLTKKAKKSSRNRKNKGKKKELIAKDSTNECTFCIGEDATKLDGKQKKCLFETADMESEATFTRLSDIYVEANADAYLKSYDTKCQQLPRHKRMKYSRNLKLSEKDDTDTESANVLTKLSDIIVQVNAENSAKNSATKPSRSSRNNNKSKDKKSKASPSKPIQKSKAWSTSNLVTKVKPRTDNKSVTIDELKLRKTCCASDIESDDSGFSSGLRSLQEINSAYAKIDKRFIEVKRSVESVVVGMKHVDEIINRQKGVFHINFACADNETFICRH